MHTYVCWYELYSDMVFQVGRIPSGDRSLCNNMGTLGLLNRYKALKHRFGTDEDGFLLINNEELGLIFAMLIKADKETDAIVTFANKMGEVNDRTKRMPT